MKNIDKYKETKEALRAYQSLYLKLGSPDTSFAKWLEEEYEDPKPPTLIEVAKELSRVLKAVRCTVGSSRDLSLDLVDRFIDAVEREKQKPLRNCDKYTDLAEARRKFNELCRKHDENCYNLEGRIVNRPIPRCSLWEIRWDDKNRDNDYYKYSKCFPMWLYMVCDDTKKE